MLTDCETPVRLRVYGSNLPTSDRPPTKAHGCNCSGTVARNRHFSVNAVQPSTADVAVAVAAMPDNVAVAGGAELPVQKGMEADPLLQNESSIGGDNSGGNGASISMGWQSNSEDSMLAPPPPPLTSLGNNDNSPRGIHTTTTITKSNNQSVGGDMIARCRGDDQMVLRSFIKEDTPAGAVEVELRPPRLAPGGSAVVWVEAWSGMFMSRAVPVLVTTDVELACTVQPLLECFRKAELSKDKVRILSQIWYQF